MEGKRVPERDRFSSEIPVTSPENGLQVMP